MQKIWSKPVIWALWSAESNLQRHIEGSHRALYFQSRSQRNIAQQCTSQLTTADIHYRKIKWWDGMAKEMQDWRETPQMVRTLHKQNISCTTSNPVPWLLNITFFSFHSSAHRPTLYCRTNISFSSFNIYSCLNVSMSVSVSIQHITELWVYGFCSLINFSAKNRGGWSCSNLELSFQIF